jgi:hypothetical protein
LTRLERPAAPLEIMTALKIVLPDVPLQIEPAGPDGPVVTQAKFQLVRHYPFGPLNTVRVVAMNAYRPIGTFAITEVDDERHAHLDVTALEPDGGWLLEIQGRTRADAHRDQMYLNYDRRGVLRTMILKRADQRSQRLVVKQYPFE